MVDEVARATELHLVGTVTARRTLPRLEITCPVAPANLGHRGRLTSLRQQRRLLSDGALLFNLGWAADEVSGAVIAVWFSDAE